MLVVISFGGTTSPLLGQNAGTTRLNPKETNGLGTFNYRRAA
jgi:hypothetical protein